jgi:Protein of unknown function (DUF3567)
MQMLYNSDNYVVVQFGGVPEEPGPQPQGHDKLALNLGGLKRGGFEIVDKTARTDIFIEGALAERFQRGVQELVERDPGGASLEVLDDYIAGFMGGAPQPLLMH